MSKKADIKKP